MSTVYGGPLVAWASAWLTGHAAFDHVLGAVEGGQLVDCTRDGAFSAQGRAGTLGEVLIVWRQAGARPRLVLPVAGDVRGLPGPPAFRTAALEAGEAVFAAGVGLVPHRVSRAPSSAPALLVWQVFDVDEPAQDYASLAEVQHELTEAIRDSASALSSAEVAGWFADVQGPLADARRAGERLDLPAGMPTRAVALVAQAERLSAVLELAGADPIGGAVDRAGIAARTDALRPLATAVRRARAAGYNALSEDG